MIGLLRLFLVILVIGVFTLNQNVYAEKEVYILKEPFDFHEIDQNKWKISRLEEGIREIVAGRLHLVSSNSKGISIRTNRKFSPWELYSLEFDFYATPAEMGGRAMVEENQGWSVGARHKRPDGGYYWIAQLADKKTFAFQSFSSSIYSKMEIPFGALLFHREGVYRDVITSSVVEGDVWYHFIVKNKMDYTTIKITEKSSDKEMLSINLPHDAGTPGDINFFAATREGLKGAYFDNILIRTVATDYEH